MKKNLLYIAGLFFTISSTLFTGCDNNDAPTYIELLTDTEALSINLDKEETEGVIHIIQGNGNYHVSSSNEAVAVATIEDNSIIVKGLKRGKAIISVRDWTRSTKEIPVSVDQVVDLVLNASSVKMKTDEVMTVGIYSGNNNYSLTVADPSIATAVLENGEIKITSKKLGKTIVKVTDGEQKCTDLSVSVIVPLVTNSIQVDALYKEDISIDIISGNGGYTFSGNKEFNANNTVRLSEDGSQIIITGKKVQQALTYGELKVSDQEGESITIKVSTDYPFLTTNTSRIRIGGLLDMLDYYGFGGTPHGETSYQELINQSYIAVACDFFGMIRYGGYGFTFSGKLSVGKKENATLIQYEEGNVKSQFPITNFEIVKIEGKTYWATFDYGGYNNHFVITINF